MPHGLCDSLRRRIVPGAFVNTASVQKIKFAALAEHQSQQHWLDVSQGLNSYLRTMDDMSLEVGRMSKKFKHAEGWRRHLHLGFSAREIDPLAEIARKELFGQQELRTSNLKKESIAMPRKLSSIAPDWWDYTTLDDDIIKEAAAPHAGTNAQALAPRLQGGFL